MGRGIFFIKILASLIRPKYSKALLKAYISLQVNGGKE